MSSMIFGQKRRIFFKLLLFAIFLATPIIGLEGATYYVSPTGSDWNPGTLANPWKTLAKSVSSVSSGDTVYLRSGTWHEKLEITSKAYTSKTTWARYPSDAAGSVILDGYELDVNEYEDGIVWVYLSNNVCIDGLKVIRAYRTGIAVKGEKDNSGYDNEILNCITDTTGQAGIEGWQLDGFLAQGNTISNANIGTMAWDDPEDPYGYEETLSITSCTNVEVCYNTLYGSERPYGYAGGEGLNVKYGSSYVYVHHNYVDQARGGPGGEANDRYCMGIDCWTDERGDTHHIYFYNNIVKNGSYGINFNSEEGGYGHHFYAWNNIIIHIGHNSHMRGGGIGCPPYGKNPGQIDHCYWWNNTIYDCYYGARFYKEEIQDIFVQNNIFYASVVEDIHFDAGVPQGEVTLDHNLYSETNPKFVNASAEDFHLMPDSPAIDAGTTISDVINDFDGIVRPKGVGYDIGAYEFWNPIIASASASPNSGQDPLTVNFTGSATGGTPPYSYKWTFDDGSSAWIQNPSHTYTSGGNFTATLTVTDQDSDKASASVSIDVSFAEIDWHNTDRLTWYPSDKINPDIAVDTNGHIHSVWESNIPGNYEIYYRKSTDGGTSWVSTVGLTWNAGNSRNPVIATDSSNTVHVVWNDDTPGNKEIYYKSSTDGGTTWSWAKRLTQLAGASLVPSIAIDANDRIHVVWFDTIPGNKEIYYIKSKDGGTNWIDPMRITMDPYSSRYPSIAAGLGNDIHLVWQDDLSGNEEIYYMKSTNSGTSWPSPERLTWNSGLSRHPQISADSGNNVHVVWADNSPGNYEIYYKKSWNGGTSWPVMTRLTWNAGLSGAPAIATDMGNVIYIVYNDSASGNEEIFFKMSRFGGGAWLTRQLTWNNGASIVPKITTYLAGEFHIVWTDNSFGNYEIFHKKGIQ